jgi:hypothetical protein
MKSSATHCLPGMDWPFSAIVKESQLLGFLLHNQEQEKSFSQPFTLSFPFRSPLPFLRSIL